MGRAIGDMVAPPFAATITQDSDDDTLVAAVRVDDARAFEALYARYQPRILAYVRSRVRDEGRAEDVTQEIFVSALRRMREDDSRITFKPWIWQIAKNACIDAHRRSQRGGEEVEFDETSTAGAGSLGLGGRVPEEQVTAKQDLESLCDAFEGLSDVQHEVLVMRELEGRSYRDIGETLAMTRPAVESTLFRARRRLSDEYTAVVSGARCEDVRRIIAAACDGVVGTREATRLSRHVAHCGACRREALVAGLDRGLLVRPRRRFVRTIPSWIPIPAALRRWLVSESGLVQQLPALSDGMSGPIPKAVAAAIVLLVGTGAGVAVRDGAQSDAATGGSAGASTPTAPTAGGSSSASSGRDLRLTSGSIQAQRTPTGYTFSPATGSVGSGSGSGAGGAGSGPGATGGSGTGGSGSSGSSGGSGGSGSGGSGGSGGADAGAGASGSGGRQGIGGAVRDTTSGAGQAAGNAVNGAGNAAADAVSGAGNAAGQTVSGAGKTAGNTVSGAGKAAGNTVSGAGKAAGNTVSGAGKAAGDTVSGAGKATGNAVSGTTKAAGDAVSGAGKAAGDAVSGATKAVGGAAGSAGKAVGDTVSGTTKAAGDAVGGAGKAAGDTVSGATKAAGDTASGATKAAGSAASGATTAAGSAASGATKAAGDTASGATKAAGSAASGATKAASETTKAATDATQAATNALGNALGGG